MGRVEGHLSFGTNGGWQANTVRGGSSASLQCALMLRKETDVY